MSTFDETGLTVDRMDEILAKLSVNIKAKWGEDHRTDPESVTGQILGIFAEMFHDQNELLSSIATIYRPTHAFGVWLSEIVKLNAIERKEAARTTVALWVGANSSGTNIFTGDLVDTEAGAGPFSIDSDVTLAPHAGTSVSAKATKTGAIEAAAGTITKILTPRLGWESVTNNAAAVPGSTEETDSDLKWRRKQTASAVGRNTTSRLYDRLLNIENVSQVKIIDNTLEAADSYGVPPQHLWIIVYGGDDAAIAQVMWEVIGGGIGTFNYTGTGGSYYDYVDTERDLSKRLYFTRPTDITINTEVQTKKTDLYPTGGDLDIRQAISDWFSETNIRLGGTVARGDLYAPAYQTSGHQVQDILIAKDPAAPTDADIDLEPYERPVCAIGDVTVTSV